jgi:hypothetical protein
MVANFGSECALHLERGAMSVLRYQDREHMCIVLSKMFRTAAVEIINLNTKRLSKLPTSTQLRTVWHTDSLDIVVLPSTGASRHHRCCINGGTSPEYIGWRYERNIEARSCNSCCNGKAISITHSECVSVDLVTQHAKRTRCLILPSLASLILPHFPALSHKRCDFQKKKVI